MPAKKLVGARKAPATSALRARALAEGYRSGLEEQVAAELAAKGHKVNFEACKIPFTQPVKPRTYTPDFPLANGIIVETKGRFMADDRTKHKLIKEQHPDLDIRFVFSRSKTTLTKASKTTYAAWCKAHGFPYADKKIPQEWLDEPAEARRVDALAAIAIYPQKLSA